MMKLFWYLFLAGFFMATPAGAAIIINEVEISPVAERFIELYNTGDSDVNLTGWYIQRKTATGSSFNSLVTKTDFENKSIKGGGYFLISRGALANSDIIIGDITLTESNIIRMRNSNGEDVDQVEWGSVDEGKSYQRTPGGIWVIASPTPGTSNSLSTGGTTPQEENSTTTNFSTTSSIGGGSSFSIEPQIFASAGEKKRTATVGGAVTFSGRVWGLKKEPIENARLLWNFGDGSTAEGKTVTHTYRYPATYIVTLDASSGYYSASDRITVEAISANVVISSLGDLQSSFIEIYNKSRYELDLSFWSIRASNTTFIIPDRTFVAAGAKIKFAGEVTGIMSKILADVGLYYPNGISAYSYSPTIPSKISSAPTNNSTQSIVVKNTEARVSVDQGGTNRTSLVQNASHEEEMLKEQTQTASAVNTYPKTSSLFWWIVGICTLAAIGIAGVFVVNNNSLPVPIKNEADSYEIIEENEDDKIPF